MTTLSAINYSTELREIMILLDFPDPLLVLFNSEISLHSNSGNSKSQQLEVSSWKDCFGRRYDGFSKCKGIHTISIGKVSIL